MLWSVACDSEAQSLGQFLGSNRKPPSDRRLNELDLLSENS